MRCRRVAWRDDRGEFGPARDGGAEGGTLTDQKYIKFGCPHCGQSGEVFWQGDGAQRIIIELSHGFHIEHGRLPDAKHVIICDACDEIDPPRVLTASI